MRQILAISVYPMNLLCSSPKFVIHKLQTKGNNELISLNSLQPIQHHQHHSINYLILKAPSWSCNLTATLYLQFFLHFIAVWNWLKYLSMIEILIHQIVCVSWNWHYSFTLWIQGGKYCTRNRLYTTYHHSFSDCLRLQQC